MTEPRGVSHDRLEESLESKAVWFQGLSLEERMDLFCSFCDLALEINPGLQGLKDAQPIKGRVQVLSKSDLIASKKAAGRPVDLEDVRILEGTASGGFPSSPQSSTS